MRAFTEPLESDLQSLPDFAARSLEAARNLADFLRKSRFPGLQDWPLFAGGAGDAAVNRLYAARADARQGLTSWLRDQITALHSSAAFDGHAAACREREPDMPVPRLRKLLAPLPSVSQMRAAIHASAAQALEPLMTAPAGGSAEKVLEFYLDSTRFSEAFADCGTDEMLAGLFQDQMPFLLDFIGKMPAPPEGDHLARGLIRQAGRHFIEMRAFERAHDLLCRLLDPPATGRSSDPGLLNDLWYTAFRLGQGAEALDWLAQWEKIRPLQKRPLVYRAIVTAVSDKAAACQILKLAGAADGCSTVGGNILYAEYRLAQGQVQEAEYAIRRACDIAERAGDPVPVDYLIALHNILTAQHRPTDALQALFRRSNLNLTWTQFGLDSLRDLTSPPVPVPVPVPAGAARVAVVMTVYNAAPYLRRAAESVLGQAVPGLKLILVDDCSEDASPDIIAALAEDDRVLALKTPRNIGTYAAKNSGIRRALDMGFDYITLCDSDDLWLQSHVSRHLEAMAENPALKCSTSQWIRVRDNGTVECGLRGGYVETCPHSTFFHADVFRTAGYFDEVRFGADREFLRRVALHFGPDAICNLQVLLTLGRRHDTSLTRSGAGAISEFNESPLRLAYWKAWNEWHLAERAAGRLPVIAAAAPTRAFAVAPDLLP